MVPITHSTNIVPLFEKAGVPIKLIPIAGAAHGFSPTQKKETVIPAMMAWFDKYLAAK